MYGGIVEYEKNYRFRHLSSGLYLAARIKNHKSTDTSTLMNSNFFYLSNDSNSDETLFHFEQIKN